MLRKEFLLQNNKQDELYLVERIQLNRSSYWNFWKTPEDRTLSYSHFNQVPVYILGMPRNEYRAYRLINKQLHIETLDILKSYCLKNQHLLTFMPFVMQNKGHVIINY